MRIVLDASSLLDEVALRDVAALPHDVIVPAVAFAEALQALSAAGVDLQAWRTALDRLGFEVEPLTAAEAARWAPSQGTTWSARQGRDAMVAAHLRHEDLLWTTRPLDYLELGVPATQIILAE